MRVYATSANPINNAAPINLWSYIEINVGIICASGPSLQQLFVRFRATLGPRKLSDASSDFQSSGLEGSKKGLESPGRNSTTSVHKIGFLRLVPKTESFIKTTCEATDVDEGELLSSWEECYIMGPDKILVSTEMRQSESDAKISSGKKNSEDFV